MPTDPEGPGALGLVTDALAGALIEHDSVTGPARSEPHGAPTLPVGTKLEPVFMDEGPTAPNQMGAPPTPSSPLQIPSRARNGDSAAVSTLSRGFARRDPIAGLDPLPTGRDSATYTTAAIGAGREPGQHFPELNAWRMSEEFPGAPFDPSKAMDTAARNLVPALMFPESAPQYGQFGSMPSGSMPGQSSMPGMPGMPGGAGMGAGAGMPGGPSMPSTASMPAFPWMPTSGAMPGGPTLPGGGSLPGSDAMMPNGGWTPSRASRFDGAPMPWIPDEMSDAPSMGATPAGVPAWLPAGAPAESDLPPWLGAASSTSPRDARSPRARASDRARSRRGIRDDFPALSQEVNGRPLIWMDSAATTQKPQVVIDAVSRFYENDNSNVHRGAHTLAARATEAYETARGKVQRFLGARSTKEIIFVRGATEGINLVANSWGRANLGRGDEILVTNLEHHSNIVPWQMIAKATGATLRVVPVDDAGDIRLDAYEAMLGPNVKLVAMTHVANAIGTVVPIGKMIAMAHRRGARTLVDAAQSAAHVPIDVTALATDFLVFSGHKIYGPTGIGVLYGRADVLEDMPPWQGGGSMIEDVTFERSVFAPLPARFEAGTPSLAPAVGLGAAIDYIESFGRASVAQHEERLMSSLLAGLASIPGLSFVGFPRARVGAVSFVIAGRQPVEVGQHLNKYGIAVRAGHHCAQPILRRLGHETTVRPSLGIYNDESDVAALLSALRKLGK